MPVQGSIELAPKLDPSIAPSFTAKQGQYLAFDYNYTKIHGQPPRNRTWSATSTGLFERSRKRNATTGMLQQTAGCEKLVFRAVQAPLRFTLEEENSPWLSWLSNRNDRVLRPRRHTGEQSCRCDRERRGCRTQCTATLVRRGGRRPGRSGYCKRDPPIRAGPWRQVGRHDRSNHRLPA